VDFYLRIVCKVHLSIVCKCCRSSRDVQQELDEVVSSEVFLSYVWAILAQLGQFRDYGSVPGPSRIVAGLTLL
jgi:hypothetical protein